jgi:hypothetical protein
MTESSTVLVEAAGPIAAPYCFLVHGVLPQQPHARTGAVVGEAAGRFTRRLCFWCLCFWCMGCWHRLAMALSAQAVVGAIGPARAVIPACDRRMPGKRRHV